MALTPRRGDVLLAELDPSRGSEIRKTRPCVVVSPDELNRHLRTLIVAPMTGLAPLSCTPRLGCSVLLEEDRLVLGGCPIPEG